MTIPLANDRLAVIADRDTQRIAARFAQDAFAGIFRLTLDEDADAGRYAAELATIEAQCRNWCHAGTDDEARALRTALLVSGLDQWGLAYVQAFDLASIPALTSLLGNLRSALDPAADARFGRHFEALEAVESDALDFKIELRRSIHLALWHAMGACTDEALAQRITEALGSLMVALAGRMPDHGWRLLADALASIQMRLLSDAKAASETAQQNTLKLFEALRRNLPAEQYQAILAHSGQAVVAWQRSRRTTQ
jgi:hypothetical protein